MTHEYKFRLVNEPPQFMAICLDCKERIDTNEPKYADLNGEAFKAYYHKKCAWSLSGFKTLTV